MSLPDAPVAVGDVLAGKYVVERVLGSGAMGVVVAARHTVLNQPVALKFLLPHRASQDAVRERFLREARAAAGLKSQHVARVSDVGMLETGAPYIVMELLDGSDLGEVLVARGRLPIAEAVDYILQVCEAVGEAHRHGIVHRDLKPANLFLTTDANGRPCVKVLDFGVSKMIGTDLKLTGEGQIMGSPLYMSTEQLQGKLDVDPRSDIWALGVILYELVAGQTPFHAENMQGLTTNIYVKSPTSLREHLTDFPSEFEAVIVRCVEKERDQRFPNVAALMVALAPFASPRESVSGVISAPARSAAIATLDSARHPPPPSAGSVPGVSAVVATTTGATTGQPAGVPPRRRKVGGVAVALVALAALALGGTLVAHWRSGPPVPAAASDATVAIIPPLPVTPSAVVSIDAPPSSVAPTVALSATATGTVASAKVPPSPHRGPITQVAPVIRVPDPVQPGSPNAYGGRK